MNLTGHFIYER